MSEKAHHIAWLSDVRTALEKGTTTDAIPGLLHVCETVLADNPTSELAQGYRAQLTALLSPANTQPNTSPPAKDRNPNDQTIYHNYLRSIDERFRKFHVPHTSKLKLETQEGAMEQTAALRERAATSLLQAQQSGVSRTLLLLPQTGTPKGVVSFIQQRHADPETLLLNREAQHVNAELFLLARILLNNGSDQLFTEGPSYDAEKTFSFQSDESILIPGTTTPLFSPEGQKLLEGNRLLLDQTIKHRAEIGMGAFDQILLYQESIHGVESLVSHNQTHEDMKNAKINILRSVEQVFQRIFIDNEQVGLLKGPPAAIMLAKVPGETPTPKNSDGWSLDTIIRNIHTYLAGQKIWAAMHERREAEVLERMKECVKRGEIPHVIFGAGHTHAVLERCAEEQFAVLMTSPTSLQYYAQPNMYADERNPQYTYIEQKILPAMEAWKKKVE